MDTLLIDYTTGEVVSQADIELKDGKRPWKEKKKMSLQNAAFMATYDNERAELMRRCGSLLAFAQTPDGDIKLHRANFCRQRMCAMCQWRRSIKLGIQSDRIYRVLTERGYKHVFVTLTVRNSKAEQLVETIDQIYKARAKFRRTVLYRRSVLGAYSALEITYNSESDTYHPHLHELWTVSGDYFDRNNSDYITHDGLAVTWKNALGVSYDPSVRIEGITQKEDQSITSVCAEICKYPVKTVDIRSSRVFQVIDLSLRGRRLIQWTGIAAKVREELNLDDIEHGNLVQADGEIPGDEVVKEMVYVWRYGCYFPLDVHAVRVPDSST